MTEIIGMVAMSHSPFATLLPPPAKTAPGAKFLADATKVAKAVEALAPDAAVVIGPDHFHANFYDVMPPFVLGVEEATAFGDFGSKEGPLPVAKDLAWSIRNGLTEENFDLSLSYHLTVDHGITQTYEMTCNKEIPLVPLVVNTAAPPLPSMKRCVALGQALGESIRKSNYKGRVLLIASGGLSHWLPSNDPRDPEVPEERRKAMIHGRKNAKEFAAAREPRVRAMAGNPNTRVNREWDTWFLKQLSTTTLTPITDLGDEGLEAQAGTGGHEIRTWLIAQAATKKPLTWTSYEPVPEWITGMGIGTTFNID